MPFRANRRTALIAAGQGMTALLLAACGKAVSQSGPSTRPAPATSGPAITPAATGVQVTVPGLEPTSPTSTASNPPRAPAGSTASSAARTTARPTAPMPPSAPSAPTRTSVSTVSPSPVSPSPVSPTPVPPSTPTKVSRSTQQATDSSVRTAPATSSSDASVSGVAGRVVAVDPGHNGANGDHPEIINQLIDGGYGQRNVCNTTGTQTDAGYSEHEFTWHVATYLKPLLEARGVVVVMTRNSDTGVGPCTDKRAAIENNAHADAVVSIHGDGAPPQVRGFYVLTASRPPAGSAMASASLRLASCIATAAIADGFPPSNTLGHGGLWKRDDLTGLNRSARPKILIECGNMRNAAEAALMSSAVGQRR